MVAVFLKFGCLNSFIAGSKVAAEYIKLLFVKPSDRSKLRDPSSTSKRCIMLSRPAWKSSAGIKKW